MPAIGSDKWDTELFGTTLDGVNSSVEPDLILPSQQSWMLNGAIRGGKPHTRPPIRSRTYLPDGLVQGASYFSVQDGMIVVSIGGLLYRIRVGEQTCTWESIPLNFPNSPKLPEAWFEETVGYLVMQDGQSDAVIYDGATATRSNPTALGVPLGRQMAYGNGRLWVAINGNQLVAGDIVTDVSGSELQFTETNYLSGGGALRFPNQIAGLKFSPAIGQGDKGPLLVFGTEFTKSVRADITSRDLWAQIPTFVGPVLDNVGSAGQKCITAVNQDLYWRDSLGGIRSLSSALADQSSSGSTPLSREVARITDYESTGPLRYSSSTYFDNRLLTLGSPFINPNGGISFKHIVALDFAPLSSMRGKAPPAYDGAWSGAQFTQLITGKFNGRQRCFGISSDSDGNNRLWEIFAKGRADESEVGESRISAYLESGRRNFGTPKKKKKLTRCDVYLSGIEEQVEMKVYWRPDNQQKWLQWDAGDEACARMEDADVSSTPHVWKNLRSQERPQIKTFTIPQEFNDATKYPLSQGFEFQLRLAWVGKARITRVLLHAVDVGDQVQADRNLLPDTCTYNDVTGNSITYTIPIRILAGRVLATEDGVDIITEGGLLLAAG